MKTNLTLYFLWLCATLGFSQNPEWKCFTTAYYVNDIAFDGNLVWVATQGGLARIDKSAYGAVTVYNQENENFVYNEVNNLVVDAQHNVWANMSASIVKFDGNTFSAASPNSLFWASTGGIAFDQDTTIYFFQRLNMNNANTMYERLIQTSPYQFPAFDSIPFPAGLDFTSAYCADSANLWVANNNGIWKYQGGQWTTLNNIPFSLQSQAVKMLSDDQNLYISLRYSSQTTQTQLYKYNYAANSFTLLDSTYNTNKYITLHCLDSQHNAWFTKTTPMSGSAIVALYKHDGISTTNLPTTNFPSNYFRTFKVDNLGHWWLGCWQDSSFNSVYEYDGNSWQGYNVSHTNLMSNSYWSATVDNQNQVWAGYPSGVATSNTINIAPISFGIPFNVRGAAVDLSNDIWVVAANNIQNNSACVRQFDGSTWTTYTLNVSSTDAHCITVDPQNKKWIGTTDGVFVYDGLNWTNYNTFNSQLPENFVYDIAANSNGDVFVGTMSGISKIPANGGVWQLLSGIGANRFFIDVNDNLWSIANNQLYRYNGVNITNIPYSFFGISSTQDGIIDITQDAYQNYWLLTTKGLIKWNGANNQIFYPITNLWFSFEVKVDHSNNKWITSSNGIFLFNENGISTSPLAIPYQPVKGKVYFDANQNGQRDSLELGMPSQKILKQPNNTLLYTNAQGNYTMYGLQDSSYTFEYQPYTNWTRTSDSVVFHAQVDTLPLLGRNFGCFPTVVKDSLLMDIVANNFSCVLPTSVYLSYQNVGTMPENGQIRLIADSATTFLSATPAPSSMSVTGDTLYFDFQNLLPFEQRMIHLNYAMPTPTTSWTPPYIPFQADIFYWQNNQLIFADNDQVGDTVLCAYDPNDKTCYPQGASLGNQSLLNDALKYVIRFQNTGNDYAYNILIRDTLDTDLDWTTFRMIAASHEVNTSFDLTTGQVDFRFDNIMLPDSNQNEPESHGFVSYEVFPKNGLPVNTEISNTAYIYFDFNPAIVTNTTQNYLVSTLATTPAKPQNAPKIYPNPSTGDVLITWESANKQTYQVSVMDLQGKVVQQHQVQQNRISLNLKDLSNGVYLIKWQGKTENGVEKVMLMR